MAYFRRSFRRFNREPTKITCAECGKEDTVPFKPREGSTVLCKECFLKKKGIVPKGEKPEAAEEEPEVVEEVEETEEVEEEPSEDFGEEIE